MSDNICMSLSRRINDVGARIIATNIGLVLDKFGIGVPPHKDDYELICRFADEFGFGVSEVIAYRMRNDIFHDYLMRYINTVGGEGAEGVRNFTVFIKNMLAIHNAYSDDVGKMAKNLKDVFGVHYTGDPLFDLTLFAMNFGIHIDNLQVLKTNSVKLRALAVEYANITGSNDIDFNDFAVYVMRDKRIIEIGNVSEETLNVIEQYEKGEKKIDKGTKTVFKFSVVMFTLIALLMLLLLVFMII